jgi:hypothetical protein
MKSPKQEDKEINDDGIRQVEKKNKINVEECTYSSTSADNSVPKHDDNGERDIPECWCLKMSLQKKVQYPRILVKNRKVGCHICRDISYLGPKQIHGLRMSHEWCKIEVCVCVGGVNVVTHQNS